MITKITIGVCIKNCEKSIKYTLKSIYEQDYEQNAIELIIVDNKSTDRTIDIVNDFLSKVRNNKIKYKIFFNKYSGLSKSRQIVVDNATGYYIIYVDGDDYYFMDTTSYEQIALRKDILGDAPFYLLPNTKVTVNFYQNNPVSVELPGSVNLKIIETEPQLKTATVTSSYKPAVLETGLKIQIPPFLSEGEVIRIDTSEGKYLERAK